MTFIILGISTVMTVSDYLYLCVAVIHSAPGALIQRLAARLLLYGGARFSASFHSGGTSSKGCPPTRLLIICATALICLPSRVW
jgi:hypothetical protein